MRTINFICYNVNVLYCMFANMSQVFITNMDILLKTGAKLYWRGDNDWTISGYSSDGSDVDILNEIDEYVYLRCRRCSQLVLLSDTNMDSPLCKECKKPVLKYTSHRDALYNVKFTQLQKQGFALLTVGGQVAATG